MNDSLALNRIKNKELTKERLIKAVGELLGKQGYSKLGVNKIARSADVDKKLIYRYFGDLETLLQVYVQKQGYPFNGYGKLSSEEPCSSSLPLEKFIADILEHQLAYLCENKSIQEIILWQISESTEALRAVVYEREQAGKKLRELASDSFKGSSANLSAIFALLTAGIYYLVLYSKVNRSPFFEIDINVKEGQQQVIRAIRQIISWACAKEK